MFHRKLHRMPRSGIPGVDSPARADFAGTAGSTLSYTQSVQSGTGVFGGALSGVTLMARSTLQERSSLRSSSGDGVQHGDRAPMVGPSQFSLSGGSPSRAACAARHAAAAKTPCDAASAFVGLRIALEPAKVEGVLMTLGGVARARTTSKPVMFLPKPR